MEKVLGRPITAKEHIHHINHIRHDNRPENLTVLSESEHYREHGKDGGYLHLDKGNSRACFVPRVDTVVSVEPAGETDVYDLQMADAGHNFVANGIIVHNCGKSRVAIELAHACNLSPLLILCPLRVVEVWREQFERHLPGIYDFLALDHRVKTVADKTRLAREKLAWATAKGRKLVIATNYESARLEPFAHWALATAWPLVIADEIHKTKSAAGAISRFLGRLGLMAKYRLGLTGTPMPHSPLDIWAQYRFLDRSIYDATYTAFRLRYAVMGGHFIGGAYREVVGWKDLDGLRAKFFSIAYQVGAEVLDLPGEREQTLYTALGTAGARVYRQMETDFVARLSSGEQLSAANKLVQLLRLQQITSGAVMTEGGAVTEVDNAKECLLEDLLEDLDAGEPVVVFTRFRYDLDVVHRVAQRLGRASAEISGRADEIATWKRPDGPPILAVQIQAGGVGIDLTRAAYAIYYSLGFNLADYLQSRARLYRSGQRRPVMFYHLGVHDSVDAMVARALARRQDLVESVLQELKCIHPKTPPA